MTGFDSKRQAAMDKVAQPAQEPVGEVNRYGRDSHGRQWHGIHWYDANVDVPHGTKLYTTPPAARPAQEPVATMKMLHTYGDTALKEKNHE
jgi:hypothetical protein